MSQSPFTAIGVDIGGTKIAAGRVTFPEGRVDARRQIATQAERGGEAVLSDVLRLARELASEAEKKNLRVQGIGLGVCELVNLTGDVVSAFQRHFRPARVDGIADASTVATLTRLLAARGA